MGPDLVFSLFASNTSLLSKYLCQKFPKHCRQIFKAAILNPSIQHMKGQCWGRGLYLTLSSSFRFLTIHLAAYCLVLDTAAVPGSSIASNVTGTDGSILIWIWNTSKVLEIFHTHTNSTTIGQCRPWSTAADFCISITFVLKVLAWLWTRLNLGWF